VLIKENNDTVKYLKLVINPNIQNTTIRKQEKISPMLDNIRTMSENESSIVHFNAFNMGSHVGRNGNNMIQIQSGGRSNAMSGDEPIPDLNRDPK